MTSTSASTSLRNQHVVLLGGTSGIGLATARAALAAGASVTVVSSSTQRVAEAVAGLGDRAEGRTVDLNHESAVRALFEQVGPFDHLVYSAGDSLRTGALVDMPLEEWNRVVEVNLTGVFLASREAARIMVAGGSPGTIVMVSSVHEQIPWPTFAHYCATKGGLKLFAQTIARELAPKGIRVVSVAPGAIETPINRDVLADPEQKQAVLDEIPLGRWGQVPDVAQAIAWVASEQASYVTGTTLFVDGGMTLYPKFV